MKHSVRIEETHKTVDIKTPQGELKFTIRLFTADEPTDSEPVETYCVEAYNSKGEGIGNVEKFRILRDAERCFDRKVADYSILVKAETVPVDDIWAYAEKIGYRKVDPDCCFNCEFSAWRGGKCNHGPSHGELVCANPENFTFFENMCNPREYRPFINRYFDDGFHPSMHDPHLDTWIHGNPCACGPEKESGGWELCAPPCDCSEEVGPGRRGRPHEPEGPGFVSLAVRPVVDFNGICKNYRRRERRPCA